jgi:DNA-directed RNA polymerase subunit F
MLKFNNAEKYVISMGNAAKIPARANIVRDKRVSTDDKESIRLVTLFHGVPSDNKFELAGNLITIKSSSDIEECMQKILEYMGVT